MTRFTILTDPPVTVQIDRVIHHGDPGGRSPEQVKAILRSHFGQPDGQVGDDVGKKVNSAATRGTKRGKREGH